MRQSKPEGRCSNSFAMPYPDSPAPLATTVQARLATRAEAEVLGVTVTVVVAQTRPAATRRLHRRMITAKIFLHQRPRGDHRQGQSNPGRRDRFRRCDQGNDSCGGRSGNTAGPSQPCSGQTNGNGQNSCPFPCRACPRRSTKNWPLPASASCARNWATLPRIVLGIDRSDEPSGPPTWHLDVQRWH